MVNWRDISSDFTEELQAEWEIKGFSYEWTKKWIDKGLMANEVDLVDYCMKREGWNKYQDKEELKKNYAKYLKLKEIDPNFTPRLQLLWEKHNFSTVEHVQNLINKGLTATEYDLANYLREKGLNPFKQELDLVQQARHEMKSKERNDSLDWVNIHKDFATKGFHKDYQEEWKKVGFTYTKAKQLLEAGFNCSDCELFSYLKKDGYDLADLTTGIDLTEARKKVSWQDIHPEFTLSDRKEWEATGMNRTETKKWTELLGFSPNHYRPFQPYRQSDKLRQVQKWKKRFNYKETEQLIKVGFKPEGYWMANWWKEQGFSLSQILELINAGLKPSDVDYARWLRDTKGKSMKWILNHSNDQKLKEEYNKNDKLSTAVIKKVKMKEKKEVSRLTNSNVGWLGEADERYATSHLISNLKLRKRYEEYGLCEECDQLRTGKNWCQTCSTKHFRKNFKSWTSDNQEIDNFIQKSQLEAKNSWQALEWIPYEQFTDIKYLAKGGFGTIFKAKCNHGYIKKLKSIKTNSFSPFYFNNNNDDDNDIWERSWKYLDGGVALKSLDNSQSIATDFLQEVAYYKLFNNSNYTDLVVRCYGISQDPKTKNYLIVMDYVEGGSLRQYLQNNYNELSLADKIRQLSYIAEGLKNVHEQGLIHRDLHSGNVLKSTKLKNAYDNCYITDLGLCRPVNEKNKENVYGVLPYVAPEVLRNKPYAQAADIYSFGIIAYEMLSGLPPYYDVDHDIQLALSICRGQRPEFKIKLPQLLENLINRCWDVDPTKRPTASELEETLRGWWQEINPNKGNFFYNYHSPQERKQTQFIKQLQEAEEFNKSLPNEVKYPKYKVHQRAVYHSRFLPTEEITRVLSQSQETSEQVYELKENSDLDSLRISSSKINLQKENQVANPSGSHSLNSENFLEQNSVIDNINTSEPTQTSQEIINEQPQTSDQTQNQPEASNQKTNQAESQTIQPSAQEENSPQLPQEQNQVNNQEEIIIVAQTQENNNRWWIFTACFRRK